MAAIKTAGGMVFYDWQWKNNRPFKLGEPRAPRWLVKTFGADYFGTVVAVFTAGASEDELIPVARLLVVECFPGCKLAASVLDLPEAGSKPRPLYGPIPRRWWLPASRLPGKTLQVASV